MRRRLGSLGIALCLLSAIVPAAHAASDPAVGVDNTAANHITTGIVLKADPAKALLEVKNNFHFWVAVDIQSATKVVLKPAGLTEDLGGIFAAGGLINPGGTASWDAVFDASSGGLATVHVHYDPLTSAGGAAALAANILTIIADSLGVSLSAADPGVLVTGFKFLMDLPQFADFIREAQQQDIWGLATSIEIMLKSQTGRAAILEALREFGVDATESQLLPLASIWALAQWVQTIKDLLWASFWGETDGTVTFWLAGTSVAAPTPTPTPTPTPAPLSPPAAPTQVSGSAQPTYFPDQNDPRWGQCEDPNAPGNCWTVSLQWHDAATNESGYRVYVQDCYVAAIGEPGVFCADTYTLLKVVPANSTSATLKVVTTGGRFSVAAYNAAGESKRINAYDLLFGY